MSDYDAAAALLQDGEDGAIPPGAGGHVANLPREQLIKAKVQAIQWAIFLAVITAIPCNVWLWRWAL